MPCHPDRVRRNYCSHTHLDSGYCADCGVNIGWLKDSLTIRKETATIDLNQTPCLIKKNLSRPRSGQK